MQRSMMVQESTSCLPICENACAILGDVDAHFDPLRAREYCGGCTQPQHAAYRCRPLPSGIMRESCNVLRPDKAKARPKFRPELFAPACPGGHWQLETNYTMGYCEHWSLGEEGPLDATQVEQSEHRRAVYSCVEPTLRGVVAGPFYSLPGQFTSFSIELSRILREGDRLVEYVNNKAPLMTS